VTWRGHCERRCATSDAVTIVPERRFVLFLVNRVDGEHHAVNRSIYGNAVNLRGHDRLLAGREIWQDHDGLQRCRRYKNLMFPYLQGI
jgi:hypothetical protein